MAKIHFHSYIHNQTVLFSRRIDGDITVDPTCRIDVLIESLNLKKF